MREAEYSEAAAQVLDILNYTNQEDVRKIPQSFIRFLTEIANKSYKANFNYSAPISGLNLRKQTKELLGFIYITWWCNEKDRSHYKNKIYSSNPRIEKRENYSVNDIFKGKKQTRANTMEEDTETSIMVYKQENLWKRIWDRIFSFFSNKKERGK